MAEHAVSRSFCQARRVTARPMLVATPSAGARCASGFALVLTWLGSDDPLAGIA